MVTNYILALLYEHNCVILPGFGGFIANRLPSKVNEVQQRVEPARKVVAFNSNLTQNDGLLATYISKEQKISFDSAAHQIDQFLQELKTEIQLKRHSSLKGIGDFYLNTEDKIVFIPEADINFSKDTFGLFPITIRKIDRGVELVSANRKEDRPSLPQTQRKTERVRSNKVLYGALLIALPIALGLFTQQSGIIQKADFNISSVFSTTNVLRNTQPLKLIDKSPFNRQDIIAKSQTPVDSAGVSATPIVTQYNIDSSVAPVPIQNETTEAIPVSNHFHIIGGSFGVVENAQKFRKELEAKGYKAYIAGTNEYGLTMVSYEGFVREDEALLFLLKVQESENSQAWILNR